MEHIYIWLSLIDELTYILLVKLLYIFKTSKNLYDISKNKEKFRNILKENSLHIKESLFNRITNNNLKEYSKYIQSKILILNVSIIFILSKKYPKELLNIYNPPICIFLRGNVSLIKSKAQKVHIYCRKYFSNYGKNVYVSIKKELLKSDVIIVKNTLKSDNHESIATYINISDVGFFDFLEKYDFKSNKDSLKIQNNKNLDIFLPFSNKIISIEIICNLIDILIIPEAMYENDILSMTDVLLQTGKDILVVPSNIYSKTGFFSNFLIKEGAEILLGKNDLNTKMENSHKI